MSKKVVCVYVFDLPIDVVLGGYKIGPTASKCSPGAARVVLTWVSWSPGSPSEGIRGGRLPQTIDQKKVYTSIYYKFDLKWNLTRQMAGGLAN